MKENAGAESMKNDSFLSPLSDSEKLQSLWARHESKVEKWATRELKFITARSMDRHLDPIDPKGVSDLVLLEEINEDTVYSHIAHRYNKDQIYVRSYHLWSST